MTGEAVGPAIANYTTLTLTDPDLIAAITAHLQALRDDADSALQDLRDQLAALNTEIGVLDARIVAAEARSSLAIIKTALREAATAVTVADTARIQDLIDNYVSQDPTSKIAAQDLMLRGANRYLLPITIQASDPTTTGAMTAFVDSLPAGSHVYRQPGKQYVIDPGGEFQPKCRDVKIHANGSSIYRPDCFATNVTNISINDPVGTVVTVNTPTGVWARIINPLPVNATFRIFWFRVDGSGNRIDGANDEDTKLKKLSNTTFEILSRGSNQSAAHSHAPGSKMVFKPSVPSIVAPKRNGGQRGLELIDEWVTGSYNGTGYAGVVEAQHGIALIGTVGVTLTNPTVENAWGDMYYLSDEIATVSRPAEDTVITDPSGDYAGRMGIGAVCAKNLRIAGVPATSVFDHIDRSAIDFEPVERPSGATPSQFVDGAYLSGLTFHQHNNNTVSAKCGGRVDNIRLEDILDTDPGGFLIGAQARNPQVPGQPIKIATGTNRWNNWAIRRCRGTGVFGSAAPMNAFQLDAIVGNLEVTDCIQELQTGRGLGWIAYGVNNQGATIIVHGNGTGGLPGSPTKNPATLKAEARFDGIDYPPGPKTLAINNTSLAGGQVGTTYSETISVSGSTPITVTASPLPAGLAYNPTPRTITGTPTTVQSKSVVITATDAAGKVVTKTLTLSIVAATSTLAMSTLDLADGRVGQSPSYSSSLNATGGTSPYTFAVTDPPPGLSISGAKLVGDPSTAGDYNVTITVTDNVGATASTTYTVTILPALPTGTGTYGDVMGWVPNFIAEPGVSSATRHSRIDAIAATGARIIRVAVNWYNLEPGTTKPAAPTWTSLDDTVDYASSLGIECYITPAYTPGWARGNAGDEYRPPTNFSDMANIITAMMTRYVGKVTWYGIWNEPNQFAGGGVGKFWKDPTTGAPNIAKYGEMCKVVGAAWAALPASVKNATRIAIGGFSTQPTSNMVGYLTTMRAISGGLGSNWHAVDWHPYIDPFYPNKPAPGGTVHSPLIRYTNHGWLDTYPAMTSKIDEVTADQGKGVIFGEFGFGSPPAAGVADVPENSISVALQGTYTAEQVKAMADLPRCIFGTIYCLDDPNTADTSDVFNRFGIRTTAGVPKQPAWDTVKAQLQTTRATVAFLGGFGVATPSVDTAALVAKIGSPPLYMPVYPSGVIRENPNTFGQTNWAAGQTPDMAVRLNHVLRNDTRCGTSAADRLARCASGALDGPNSGPNGTFPGLIYMAQQHEIYAAKVPWFGASLEAEFDAGWNSSKGPNDVLDKGFTANQFIAAHNHWTQVMRAYTPSTAIVLNAIGYHAISEGRLDAFEPADFDVLAIDPYIRWAAGITAGSLEGDAEGQDVNGSYAWARARNKEFDIPEWGLPVYLPLSGGTGTGTGISDAALAARMITFAQWMRGRVSRAAWFHYIGFADYRIPDTRPLCQAALGDICAGAY